MSLNPAELRYHLDILEEVEKATIRLVTRAIYDFRNEASEIFLNESDLPGDIGEDITREVMDSIGVSKIPIRLFGEIDYKRARYVFHPEYMIKQALFVDSKAEKIEGQRTATLQTSQISMRIRLVRRDNEIDIPGKLPPIIQKDDENFLTTTIFVKYNYQVLQGRENQLMNIIIAGLPNGMLQDRYNPHPRDTIWRVGRDAPSLGEDFRVRLHFDSLKEKTGWRVQRIELHPKFSYEWSN